MSTRWISDLLLNALEHISVPLLVQPKLSLVCCLHPRLVLRLQSGYKALAILFKLLQPVVPRLLPLSSRKLSLLSKHAFGQGKHAQSSDTS